MLACWTGAEALEPRLHGCAPAARPMQSTLGASVILLLAPLRPSGNVQPSPNFEPVLPPIPAQLTKLAQCLLGIDAWEDTPAVWWLLEALRESAHPKETVRAAEKTAVAIHRGLLFEHQAALTSRLIHLADGTLGPRHVDHMERSPSPLSECSGDDIKMAAVAALEDKKLFKNDPREKHPKV